eukprot:TRINITY_DN91224_c0_g1_i1.p1 TRINITY_DN91224_c0_g1~~TRINITY_DN91224_c0_g1_i1.p1  ORF type:complete len:1091 (-),score=130.70 TRINITY_DN91224_c0_g1_i1:360-3632(-)
MSVVAKACKHAAVVSAVGVLHQCSIPVEATLEGCSRDPGSTTCETTQASKDVAGSEVIDMEVSLLQQQKLAGRQLTAAADMPPTENGSSTDDADAIMLQESETYALEAESGWDRRRRWRAPYVHQPRMPQGDCKRFGCSWESVAGRSCQCSRHCRVYENCCHDYDDVCAEPIRRLAANTTTTTTSADPLHRCELYGCSKTYQHDHACQCLEECFDHSNCCFDYKEQCSYVALSQRRRSPSRGHCIAEESQNCSNGATRLAVHQACDPLCSDGLVPLGPWTCSRGGGVGYQGPGCGKASDSTRSPHSLIDSVADATQLSDMVFKGFGLVNGTSGCLIWPKLPDPVKKFIIAQAGKYGPSQAAITHKKQQQPMEFFLNYDQVSVLLAQLLCGATEKPLWRGFGRDMVASHLHGSQANPQVYAFGRAMQHWYFTDSGEVRDPEWRRTTLVGYGTFNSETGVPDASSTIRTGYNLTVSSGCNDGSPHDFGAGADDGLEDSKTLTVVFAGHWVGGFLHSWTNPNNHGAQEEKFATIVPELLLATEPLRHMGAGLLSSGDWDPWKPMAGWYIIGAGTFVKGSYPLWTEEPVAISDKHDYIEIGTARRVRRRGIVGIMAKPCSGRPGCYGNGNSEDMQYRCFNQQVDGKDLYPEPEGGNLWGIAGGAYRLANWPPLSRSIMEEDKVVDDWVLQAGGWGAGAYGCGSLYGGLVQLLAAKKGGWRNMRMCWASKEESYPTIQSKMGYATGFADTLREDYVKEIQKDHIPLLLGQNVDDFKSGKIMFTDDRYGAVAAQLHQRIEQYEQQRSCESTQCIDPKSGRRSATSTCLSRMEWCCNNKECPWHRNKREDIRDFVAKTCNRSCAGVCMLSEDVPEPCRKKGRGAEADERSCETYGCGEFKRGQRCQCTLDCKEHHNCCADFDKTCQQGLYLEESPEAFGEHSQRTCKAYGCSAKWQPKQHCQCAELCGKFGNCCQDYNMRCSTFNENGNPRQHQNTTIPVVPRTANQTSCLFYGCSHVQQRFWECQCHPGCNATGGTGTCCDDMPRLCGHLQPAPNSCAHYGCGGQFNKEHQCQCIASCKKYGSCCSDYDSICTKKK